MQLKRPQKQLDRSHPDFYKSNVHFPDGAPKSGREIDKERRIEKLRSMSSHDKDRMMQDMRDLESKVQPTMLTKNEMWPGKDEAALQRNALAQSKRDRDPKLQANIHKLKEMRRQLDPENPNAGNIEYLRDSPASKLATWS